MRLVIQREGLCNHAVNTCERCLGIVVREPLGSDRPCILELEDDGRVDMDLTIKTKDGNEKTYHLTPEMQALLITEGWQNIFDEIDAATTEG